MLGAWLAFLSACSESGARVDPGSLPVESRAFHELEEFIAGYWKRPVPLQGDAPETFSSLEASLQPATCGTCHVPQYEDWQTTIHSGAFSPGLAGQLVNWESYDYETVRSCLACHAPLSEQSAQVPDTTGVLVSNPVFDASLQQSGLVCAACHVRGWQRYGPPRRDGQLTPAAPPGSPHGGATRTEYFEDSRFCAGCHQFEFPAPNGKSLQNTFEEWEASRYAEQGLGCQGCHMPERRHLWRGVHDSLTVASGVTIEWVEGFAPSVAFRVTNSGTGHRFPTYVTPEVVVGIELLDADRRVIEGSAVRSAIRRVVESRSGIWVELSDTRLAPDSNLTLSARVEEPRARFARGTVVVYPDAFYQRMFGGMMAGSLSDTSAVLISEAYRRASESAFTIFDDTIRVR
jgi:hypothetical protein